jgi:hypothetical protein
VYDGPEGDFLTPGTLVTVAPGGQPEVLSAQRATQEGPVDDVILSDVLRQAPQVGAAGAGRESNPLKRLGIWPPAPQVVESRGATE